MDRTLDRSVTSSLKHAADAVADDARQRAKVGVRAIPAGRRPRRRMRDTIRPFARARAAGVRVTAVAPDGFPYPRRIEYENGGRDAFLRPALEANRDEVERRAARILDDMADAWEGRGTA